MLTIIGYGEMAEAILSGLKKANMEMIFVEVAGRNEKKLKRIASLYSVQTSLLQENLYIEGKKVILAVKPNALEEVASHLRGTAKILISILAGTPLATLRQAIWAKSYVRAMPNIAATRRASTTSLTGDLEAKEVAIKLFQAIGRTIWLNSEKELDIATAIAGSGPAFLAQVAEALMDGGVACGLKREDAKRLVEGLFFSFSSIADEHPALIKDKVMSPAGTTAAGYKALEDKGVRAAFIEAVTKAFERTQH